MQSPQEWERGAGVARDDSGSSRSESPSSSPRAQKRFDDDGVARGESEERGRAGGKGRSGTAAGKERLGPRPARGGRGRERRRLPEMRGGEGKESHLISLMKI